MQLRNVMIAISVLGLGLMACGTEADVGIGEVDTPSNDVTQEVMWQVTGGDFYLELEEGTMTQIDLDGSRMTNSARDYQPETDLIVYGDEFGIAMLGYKGVRITDATGRVYDDGKGNAGLWMQLDDAMSFDTVLSVETATRSQYLVGKMAIESHNGTYLLHIPSRTMSLHARCPDQHHCD